MFGAEMDILEIAIAQRIGGADGELVEALCAEICRLRSKEVVAWMVEDGITIREDFAAMLGWTGATVGTGRAIPKSWSPMLYSPMMANALGQACEASPAPMGSAAIYEERKK